MAQDDATIAAVATAPGQAGIGIVRVSGPGARDVARALLGRVPVARVATRAPFRDAGGEIIDDGIALLFSAPASYTGEDVLELHGHGGPVVLDLVLRAALGAGARLARPGEFSERAFLNGKIDLTRAEAVADLIASASERAARAAARSLQGVFAERVHAIIEALIELRVRVEASIDFPEEEVTDPDAPDVDAVRLRLDRLLAEAQAGVRLRDGLDVVIAGRPNVGKSSLLNRLARSERAIVAPTPGTTRDLLREQVIIAGRAVQLIDTAGLHETTEAVEREGMRRAREAIAAAEQILVLIDDRDVDDPIEAQVSELAAPGARVALVRNKIDLSARPPGLESGPRGPVIRLSAATGAGLELLERYLAKGIDSAGEGAFTARRRHLEALEQARELLATAAQAQPDAAELVAEHLRLAQLTLAGIGGDFSSDDLLGEIFSTFCIGK